MHSVHALHNPALPPTMLLLVLRPFVAFPPCVFPLSLLPSVSGYHLKFKTIFWIICWGSLHNISFDDNYKFANEESLSEQKGDINRKAACTL